MAMFPISLGSFSKLSLIKEINPTDKTKLDNTENRFFFYQFGFELLLNSLFFDDDEQ